MKPSILVRDLRKANKVSQVKLCEGLLSKPELSRFENDDNEIPYAVTEALVQRLGKSCDKFALQINTDDYREIMMRQIMAHNLLTKEDLICDLCAAYQKETGLNYSIHRQYYHMIQGCAKFLRNHDVADSIRLFEQAVSCTCSGWRADAWTDLMLCTQEIQVLMLMCYVLMEDQRYGEARRILSRLEEYITSNISDEEEYARICPQLCYLSADEAVRSNDTERVRHYLRKGRQCLIKNGLLSLVTEYLEMEILYGEDPETAKEQRDAFLYAYDLADYEWKQEVFLQFVLLNQHHEVILVHELIRDTRKHRRISQEELSWEICATETLSRIEGGKRSPHRKKKDMLYEKLQLDRISYEVMDTDDYRLLEKDRLLRRALSGKEMEFAEKLFPDIRDALDDTIQTNRQYTGRYEVIFQVEKQAIRPAQAILKLQSLTDMAHAEDGGIYRTPTINEFYILLQIAIYYGRQKEYDRAIELLKSLLDRYRQSEVIEEYHAREYYLIYVNLAGYYALTGSLREAEDIIKKGMQLASACRRGDMFATLLGNLAYVYYRKKGKKREAAKIADAGCRMLSFYQRDADAAIISRIK